MELINRDTVLSLSSNCDKNDNVDQNIGKMCFEEKINNDNDTNKINETEINQNFEIVYGTDNKNDTQNKSDNDTACFAE